MSSTEASKAFTRSCFRKDAKIAKLVENRHSVRRSAGVASPIRESDT